MDGQPKRVFDNTSAATRKLFIGLLNQDPKAIRRLNHKYGGVSLDPEQIELLRPFFPMSVVFFPMPRPIEPPKDETSPNWASFDFAQALDAQNLPCGPVQRLQKKTRQPPRDATVEKQARSWGRLFSGVRKKKRLLTEFLVNADQWRSRPLEELQTAISPFLWRCQDPRCSKFFLARDGHARAYCSRKCAGRTTARKSMKTRWQNERNADFRRAHKAITKWDGQGDWKAYVAAKADVTKNWLTYAVKAGDLQPPRARAIQSHTNRTIPHT